MKGISIGRALLSSFVLVSASMTAMLVLAPECGAAGRGKPFEPVPTYPSGRIWHSLAANGSSDVSASRIYMLGGSRSDTTALDDFWYYAVSSGNWVLAPYGKSKPGRRLHAGLSCGPDECVTSNGSNGVRNLEETWIYSGARGAWTKVNCRKNLCPSARMMVSMAYDPGRSYHLLFGGLDSEWIDLDDTYTFDGKTWVEKAPLDRPDARRRAAMAFVPSAVNGLVLFGGEQHYDRLLCDMWAWDGDNWQPVATTGEDPPCLFGHSMAWDGARLVVTGGYIDLSETANREVWYFEFDSAESGSWSRGPDFSGCYASVKPGARMAHDESQGLNVFFGGGENVNGGTVVYDETVLCD